MRLVCAVTVAAGEEKGVGGSEPACARASVWTCARAQELAGLVSLLRL